MIHSASPCVPGTSRQTVFSASVRRIPLTACEPYSATVGRSARRGGRVRCPALASSVARRQPGLRGDVALAQWRKARKRLVPQGLTVRQGAGRLAHGLAQAPQRRRGVFGRAPPDRAGSFAGESAVCLRQSPGSFMLGKSLQSCSGIGPTPRRFARDQDVPPRRCLLLHPDRGDPRRRPAGRVAGRSGRRKADRAARRFRFPRPRRGQPPAEGRRRQGPAVAPQGARPPRRRGSPPRQRAGARPRNRRPPRPQAPHLQDRRQAPQIRLRRGDPPDRLPRRIQRQRPQQALLTSGFGCWTPGATRCRSTRTA